MNLITSTFDVEIIEYPKGKKGVIQEAINDITKFLDTKTAEDTILFWALVDAIDGQDNPLKKESRNNILENSPLTHDSRFVLQELAILKVNKSWHSSNIASECTAFGDECTNRGTEIHVGKRGRKSSRSANEYHALKPTGVIAREQLTTRAVEALWREIPQEAMVSATHKKTLLSVEEIGRMKKTDVEELMRRIKEVQG